MMEQATGSLVLGAEVWVMIVKKLGNYHDVERVCIALPDLRAFIKVYLRELRDREAIACLLLTKAVSLSDTLKMRQVCKNWQNAVDAYISKPLNQDENIPYVTIKLPLDQNGFRWVKELARSSRTPFLGGRLVINLQLSDVVRTPSSPSNSEILNFLEASNALWKNVKEVVVRNGTLFNETGVLQSVVGPWLTNMTNVISIRCNLKVPGVEAINCLPNRKLLEYVNLGALDLPFREPPINWTNILEPCCANLKTLVVPSIDESLKVAMEYLRFPELLKFFATMYNYRSEEGPIIHSKHDPYLFGYITPDRFPKLRLIAISFFNKPSMIIANTRRRRDNEDEERISRLSRQHQNTSIFAYELVDFTKRLPTLETIHLLGAWQTSSGIQLEDYPICSDLTGKGSETVTRLVVEGEIGHFNNVLQWSKNLSNLFSSVKYLLVGKTQMVKSNTGEYYAL